MLLKLRIVAVVHSLAELYQMIGKPLNIYFGAPSLRGKIVTNKLLALLMDLHYWLDALLWN